MVQNLISFCNNDCKNEINFPPNASFCTLLCNLFFFLHIDHWYIEKCLKTKFVKLKTNVRRARLRALNILFGCCDFRLNIHSLICLTSGILCKKNIYIKSNETFVFVKLLLTFVVIKTHLCHSF